MPAPRESVRRVLLMRPDHVGDVLLSAPAVALLRASLPQARVTYLVGPWSAAAARHGPPVDELRTLAFPGFTRRANANLLAPYLTLARTAVRLRAEQYDLAVVLRGDHWWGALLALAAGIPIRVGGDSPETRPLLTHVSYPARETTWAEQSLDIARLAVLAADIQPVEPNRDGRQFNINDAARSAADRLWQQHGLDARRVVGIHPAAGAPLKSWPHERWARLADQLVATGHAVALIGAPDDAALLSTVQAHMHACAVSLCGQALDVSAALYARCAVVISVDSGAGHLAAAVGTPTVRLYGPASARIFGPLSASAHQRVLTTDALDCAPCGSLESPPCGARVSPACMLALDVEDVMNAVRIELDQG